jgi:esterase
MSSGPDALSHPEAPHRPAPYNNRFVTVAGLRLHYLDYGSPGKPTMLCIHGGAAHAHWYDFVAGGFSQDYHVLALDLRGHGDSDWGVPPSYPYRRYADDLFEAVDKLGLNDFVLIGHSMGGLVSLLYAATHPGRVQKLIVVDTALNMTGERLANMRKIGLREGRSYASHEEYQQRYRLRPAKTTATHEVIAHIAKYSGRQYPDHLWRHKVDRNVQSKRVSLNGIPLWDHIDVPALLVKGALSERLSAEVVTEIRSHCPHVQLAEVPGAEHHVMLDNPPGFVQAVRGFLSDS